MSLKKNVVANYIGQAYAAIMSLAFVPLYIKYLGIESYGLIGIFVILQAWLSLLDMGMKPALSREMARFTGGGLDSQAVWNLLRSIEFIGVLIAGVTALAIFFASDWLANNWIQSEHLSTDLVARAMLLMGVVIATRFIENVYTNSIAGLQRHVLLNVVTIVMATLRSLGSVAVLIWVSPTIDAFFIWQGLVSAATAIIFFIVVYRILPRPPSRARFSVAAIRSVWKFAAGMMGITFLALLLTQLDKILLSRMLTLEAFAYYSLAAVVAGGLSFMTAPIANAFYPRFTELHTRGDERTLIEAYHLGSQLVSVLTGSVAMLLIFFSTQILDVWTGDAELTERVAPIMSVLALGSFFNGLMWMPYQMQLAYGWTSLTIKVNTVAVLLLVPTLLWAVPIYGALGAAWVWVVLNASYIVFVILLMHRRVLPGEMWRWYGRDVTVPLGAGVAVALLYRWLAPTDLTRFGELVFVTLSFGSILIVTAVFAPLVRAQLALHTSGRLSALLGKGA